MRRSRRSMGAGKLKGIRRVRQDGKVYRYHRATGIRLPDGMPETHTDFIMAYAAAEEQNASGKPKPKRGAAPAAGTLAFAWWTFCKSDDFLDLSSGYRENLHRHGDAMTKIGGHVPVVQIREKHINADMAGLRRNAKRMRLKTWRALMAFLKTDGQIENNPASRVDMPRPGKAEKHKIWNPDHVKAFRNRWPMATQQRLAMELMLFVGCRICDAVRLGPGMVDKDEGWLRFTQKKTKGDVEIPLNRTLPDFADHETHAQLVYAMDARAAKHMTWLVTAYGSARSEKAASNWFSKACRDAGLKGVNRRTAHGLRGTCATRLAERGASTHQIGAWTGHESLSEIEDYTKAAARRALLSGNKADTKIVQVSKS